jgi:hypothetical protein
MGGGSVSAEEWRPIPGFPNYEVSNLGRVLSRHLWRGDRGPRVLRPQLDGAGYPSFSLHGDGERRTVAAHRLVAWTFLGSRPDGQEIRHLDGNCLNNSLDNLAYGTPSQNKQDAVRHGTHNHARKTHCVNGHLFDEANTYVCTTPGFTGRTCRTCNRAAQRRRKERLMMQAAGIEVAA